VCVALNIEKFMIFSGYLISFGLAVNLFYIFLCAYLNDNQVVININNYGEAKAELILIPITLIFCLIGLFLMYKRLG